MRQILFLLLSLLSLNALSQRTEKYFRFVEPDKNKVNSEITRIVSIDKVHNDTVWAYANSSEFEKIIKLGYKVEILTNPSLLPTKVLSMATDISQMSEWNRYPTYEVYRAMMKKFESDYPNLCKLDSIGTTIDGRKLYVVKISNNVTTNEAEPEVFYTSTIHGDETTGYVLMLRLIDYLLSNYDVDPRIRQMVDNMAIYINPNANPDGTYNYGNSTVSGSTRYNGNNVDLNRNFPDPRVGDHPDGNSWQLETTAMMNFANQHNFTISANFHGGTELANYPWDTWVSSDNPHADNDWFYTVSRAYADTIHKYSPSDYFTGENNGVTHGGDWYVVAGGRQDYMNYWHHCREITFEISDTKLLSTDLLPAYWEYIKASMLNYIELVYTGFYGSVTNSSGEPLHAKITVLNHDTDSSEVFTNSNFGNYYRMIAPGTYSITYSSKGYTDYTVNNVAINSNESKIINVVLDGSTTNQNISGTVLNNTDNQPITGASLTVTSGSSEYQTTTNSNGEFSINSVPTGTVQISISADGFYSTTYRRNLTSTNFSFSLKLIEKQSISGYIYNAETNEPIEGVSVSIVDGNNNTNTDSNGFFELGNLFIGTDYLKLTKEGFAGQIIKVELPQTSLASVYLKAATPENFETSIPEGITFANGNWSRENTTAYNGDFCMKSAPIGNSQQTTMSLTLNIIEDGTISFARRVSSESGYDFLKFYIDDVEVGSWSGEISWDEELYSITTGTHSFVWKYIKDGNSYAGSDCAWIDYINIPTNTQTINFAVKINETPQEGLSVICNNQTIATDAEGNAIFNNISKGEVPFKVLYENVELGNGLVNVYWSDIDYSADFTNYSNVSFLVKNYSGSSIEGATVNFNQNQQTTSSSGTVNFVNAPFGQNSNYSVTMDGFDSAQGNVKVYRDSTYTIILNQTGISNVPKTIKQFTVSPNPFKDKTTITCEIGKPTYVNISIFDISGHLVLNVFEGNLSEGEYRWNWTHNEYNTSKASQNIYIVKIKCNGKTVSKKIIHIN
ncbi:MAG: M14 family zinc carboxypeptidase [Bacteroidales bacterium]